MSKFKKKKKSGNRVPERLSEEGHIFKCWNLPYNWNYGAIFNSEITFCVMFSCPLYNYDN